MIMKRYILSACFIVCCFVGYGQRLAELLQQAEKNYPLLKAKSYDVQASREKISNEKSGAIPTLDAAYQMNYATYNNITGMASGQYFVPISGPPSTSNQYDAVFGSVGSLLLNWEPFTFGQRSSRVHVAKANLDYQEADAAQETFSHQIKVAHAYLDLVMLHELIKVYQKNLERAGENLRIVRSLTASGLRPGVDTALFNAEFSRARIELLTHTKILETQRISFAELLGAEQAAYEVDSSFFKNLPDIINDSVLSNHPLIRLSAAKLQINNQEKIALRRSLNPKLSLWGTAYARGSGIRYDGYVDSNDGLSFSRYNYGMGLTVSVPLLRFTNINHQLRSYDATIQSQQERLNLVKLQLDRQNEVADVTLSNAIQIAHENPTFYQSATFAYKGLQSRYNSGLVNYVDLVQAQYTLLKAEVDMKRSYLEAWKTLLYKAAVQGDLNIFINQLN
jgi:outer membrane protein